MWGHAGPYQEWATFLEEWRTGAMVDATGLPPLTPEDLTTDAWERLSHRLLDAISVRLRGWATALMRATAAARDEFGVALALAQARSGLHAIRALAVHPGLPADLRERLLTTVDSAIRSAQQSLEDSVRDMRRDGRTKAEMDARLRTIRDNSLEAVVQPGNAPAPPAPTVDPLNPSRRRIAFD
jgi:hypothetical protein